ncbi:cytochrome P450 [Streptomyces olivoreticuli]
MTRTPPATWATAPAAWPLLGHLPAFARDPLGFLAGLPAHGDLVEVGLGGRRVFVPCRPDLARRIMADGRAFDRTGPVFDRIRKDLGNGLATCPHAQHRRQRLLIQPAFRRERTERYAALMREEIDVLGRSWRPGQIVDVVDAMFTLTTSVAVRTLFSSRIDARATAALRQCLDVFLRGTYVRTLLPVTACLPTPANRRYTRALAHWRRYVCELVAEGRRRGSSADDLLSALLEACDNDRAGMTERELSDQVMVLVLAGAETTSAVLSWAWQLLGRHPETEEQLFAEANAVLHGRAASLEDLPRLEHTGHVVTETLRLYPPAWAVLRTVTHDTELAGHRLPVGASVLFSPYILHRRADLYADPDSFRPDRWLPDAHTGRSSVPPGAFLPFGAGATRCIGESFALTEAALALASLAARWRLRPVPGHAVRAAARTVLAPRTLPMEVLARR